MSERMRRVDALLRGVVSEAVGQLTDPRIGFVTVTGVRTSPDLSHATVYVSVLGNPRRRERCLNALAAAHGLIQRRIAEELSLKRTPVLAFEYDPSVERGVRLTRMLDELVRDDTPDA